MTATSRPRSRLHGPGRRRSGPDPVSVRGEPHGAGRADPARPLVLRKHFGEFVLRVLIQPFLLVFVFLYVFPHIGQGVGAGQAAWPSRRSPRCWCRA